MKADRFSLSRRDFLRATAAAAPALVSCSLTTAPTEAEPLTARPGTPTSVPAPGLSYLGLGSGDRDGVLYVPASYNPAIAAPLLVALHGAGGSGLSWASYPGRAEARGFILLAPDSRGPTWDVIRGRVGPDVTFLDRALAHTFARCRINSARICLGGFSDGATTALALGLANGNLFTHLAIFSPGFFAQVGPPVGKPKVFVSHGTGDPILQVTASRDVIVPRLVRSSYDVTYREFDGGHEVPSAISDAALDWFAGVTP